MSQTNASELLPKAYEPAEVENSIYSKWESAKCFHGSEKSDKPKYSIVIPPPNVTGMLTMGHVLNNTLQDILIRFQRMQGREAMWLPGTDHAGIATQNVVEKALAKEKTSRHDL
ncbi:MAG TPA: class I tRNA ligase family protein, partial [Candidatus Rifleibacterium sp.]|nr:class I tRNA ligase family protein [Candidatus Rifleibacterium sp.]